MNRKTDIYHRWVAWSEEDQAYIGRCPAPLELISAARTSNAERPTLNIKVKN